MVPGAILFAPVDPADLQASTGLPNAASLRVTFTVLGEKDTALVKYIAPEVIITGL
jgi:hypothetical protein